MANQSTTTAYCKAMSSHKLVAWNVKTLLVD